MKKEPIFKAKAGELRRQAEARLHEQKQATRPLPEADTARLVHELQVHQIELEMQNDELMHARDAVEIMLRQYSDLYDFAPIGYFTLSLAGIIIQVNLTGAKLLGVERGNLINQYFRNFINNETKTTFDNFLNKTFKSEHQETCEIILKSSGKHPNWLQILATAQADQPRTCRTVVIDITDRKEMEDIVRHFIEELGNRAKSPNQ